LIDRYAAGSDELRGALERAPLEMRKWRPAPGEFSVHEIVVHCADSETNSHGRIRYILAEDSPTIHGYDPANWATTLNYMGHPVEAAMQTVEAVRANTVPILRSAPEASWARAGTHTESGPYSAEDWLVIYAAHCHEHAEQIDATVETWRAAGEPA
jgi:hypothetical protein